MENRIFFKNNPYPNGHKIVNFEWSGRLDAERGLLFDFHLESDKYYAEDKTDEEIENSEEMTDWNAKIVWRNYHRCTLSSTKWHYGGIVVGAPDYQFDFASLANIELTADLLPETQNLDPEERAFYIYLLGHDSCANHKLTFHPKEGNLFDIHWAGKIALTYGSEEEFSHDFEAFVSDVRFEGIFLCDDLDLSGNPKLLESCVFDINAYKLVNGRFEYLGN